MARRLRIEFPGAIYHVTCRLVGSWRDGDRDLYIDDHDRWRFLDGIGERVETFEVVLHQYVLMQNHFHLVIETPRANCSAFMQALLTAYTVYFNRRHERHGHVFDGRYKAKLVQGDEYLLSLSRYVHLNPVRIESMQDAEPDVKKKSLESYYWSSYLQYIGRRKWLDFLTCGPTLALMGGKAGQQPARYRRFVESAIEEPDEEFAGHLRESVLSIGDKGFRDWVQGLYDERVEQAARPEDAAFRRATSRLTAGAVLDTLAEVLGCDVSAFQVRRRGGALRPFAARYLTRFAGLDEPAVAGFLGLGTGAAVSAQLKRFSACVESDRRLKRQARRCEVRLVELIGSADGAGQGAVVL